MNAVDRELGRVVIDADAHVTRIRGNIVDPIRNSFAKLFIDEVMHIDFVGATLRSIVTARILLVADQLFLFGINRDHRLTSILEGHDLLVDMLELGIPVGMVAALLAG